MRRPDLALARTAAVDRAARIALLTLATLSSGACTALDNVLASVPVFAFLREAPFFDPYEAPRPEPPNAVPFETPTGVAMLPEILPTQASLLEFAQSPYGQNPLESGDDAALALGQVMYDRFCMVCHGATGQGNGPVVQPGAKFPLGPSLLTPTAAGYSDGYLYGVIAAGRGLMPPYGGRLNHTERWATVAYVRQLQGGAPASEPAAEPADTASAIR